MLTFAFPWLALLLPLPLLVWWLLPVREESRRAVQVPFFAALTAASGLRPSDGVVTRQRGFWRTVTLGAGPCRADAAAMAGTAAAQGKAGP